MCLYTLAAKLSSSLENLLSFGVLFMLVTFYDNINITYEHVSYVILNVHEIIFKMRGHLPIFENNIFASLGGGPMSEWGKKWGGGRYPLK